MLWIEFRSSPSPIRATRYFARVTMHSADPMLDPSRTRAAARPARAAAEHRPEPIRSIVPNQPEDSSGLDAMQRLTPAEGDGPIRHFLLPLPTRCRKSSPGALRFLRLRVCVGHAEGWSTAQARFGLAQRVTGVQHPAPA